MKRLIFIALIIAVSRTDLLSAQRRMLGPNITMSWASSYLSIESSSVKVENEASWSYATAAGWFFDYMLNPFISLRTNWFFYPATINNKPENWSGKMGEIPLHEMGLSVNRHFNLQPINPWFGAGPFLQFSTIDDPNSYILHAVLSMGFDCELMDDTFLCPELMFGIGARLFSGDANTVQINVPTGKDFTSSGIVIFFKIGIGRTF